MGNGRKATFFSGSPGNKWHKMKPDTRRNLNLKKAKK